MGQKIHPIGFRIGVIRQPESTWYAMDKDFGALVIEDAKIRKYVKKALYSAGVSRIEIERAAKPDDISNQINLSSEDDRVSRRKSSGAITEEGSVCGRETPQEN